MIWDSCEAAPVEGWQTALLPGKPGAWLNVPGLAQVIPDFRHPGCSLSQESRPVVKILQQLLDEASWMPASLILLGSPCGKLPPRQGSFFAKRSSRAPTTISSKTSSKPSTSSPAK